jgi:nucleoside-diphosphate-sugar epimerase
MRVGVIGTGHVGLVTAVTLTDVGHEVGAVDDFTGPVNLGNPEEVTLLELAERVRIAVGAEVPIEFTQRPEDGPQVGRPDISLAGLELGWGPKVPLETGLERMVAWASETWTT